jgi:hypothetical protein
MLEFSVNEQIVNILRVPTAPFARKEMISSGKISQQKSGRLKKNSMVGESAPDHDALVEQSADLIFVLTSNFNTILYSYSTESGIIV